MAWLTKPRVLRAQFRFSWLLRVLVVWLLWHAGASAARAADAPPAKQSLAVMPIKAAKGVSRDIADVLTELIATIVDRMDKYSVISASEVETWLTAEGQKDQLGCEDVSCATNIAGALGANYMIFGKAWVLANELQLRITWVDARDTKVMGRAVARMSYKDERVYEARLVAALEEVFGVKLDKPKGQPTSDYVPPPPPDSNGPVVESGDITKAVSDINIVTMPKDGVRLDLTDPKGQKTATVAPYKNPTAVPGTWKVVATRVGFVPEELSFDAPPDDIKVVRITLTELGGLSVGGKPAGAKVDIAGPKSFAMTGGLPWKAQGLRPGAYNVTVSRPGYRTAVKSITVEPGKSASLTVELERDAVPTPSPTPTPTPPPTPTPSTPGPVTPEQDLQNLMNDARTRIHGNEPPPPPPPAPAPTPEPAPYTPTAEPAPPTYYDPYEDADDYYYQVQVGLENRVDDFCCVLQFGVFENHARNFYGTFQWSFWSNDAEFFVGLMQAAPYENKGHDVFTAFQLTAWQNEVNDTFGGIMQLAPRKNKAEIFAGVLQLAIENEAELFFGALQLGGSNVIQGGIFLVQAGIFNETGEQGAFTLAELGVFNKQRDDWLFAVLQLSAWADQETIYGGVVVGGYNQIRNFYGVMQLGGVNLNEDGDFVGGFQIGGINAAENFHGPFQIGGANGAGHFYGVGQIGLLNYIDDEFFGGVRIGGVNWDEEGEGISVAELGLFNYQSDDDDRIKLLQVGVINWGNGAQAGLQAGIYNRAHELYGVQLGLINSAERLYGVQLGLINMVEEGAMFNYMVIFNIGM